MKEYTLYLDESEINMDNGNNLFVIGGIIIENNYHDEVIKTRLNNIKNEIWNGKENSSTYVLHEFEVTLAHFGYFKKLKRKYHRIFAKSSKYKLLYNKLSDLISSSDIVTIGACMNQDKIKEIYDISILNDRKSILMQIIIENFYHFLYENDSLGSICYEAMPKNQNEIIQKRYNAIKNTGTMYYPSKNINKRITGINFIKKDDNIAGLQIADFIPNTLGRVECNKESKSEKNYQSVYNSLYDGKRNLTDKFGLKIIP